MRGTDLTRKYDVRCKVTRSAENRCQDAKPVNRFASSPPVSTCMHVLCHPENKLWAVHGSLSTTGCDVKVSSLMPAGYLQLLLQCPEIKSLSSVTFHF